VVLKQVPRDAHKQDTQMEWLVSMTFESEHLIKAEAFVETNRNFYFVFPYMKCKFIPSFCLCCTFSTFSK